MDCERVGAVRVLGDSIVPEHALGDPERVEVHRSGTVRHVRITGVALAPDPEPGGRAEREGAVLERDPAEDDLLRIVGPSRRAARGRDHQQTREYRHADEAKAEPRHSHRGPPSCRSDPSLDRVGGYDGRAELASETNRLPPLAQALNLK